MYEGKSTAPLSHRGFLRRMAGHCIAATLFILASLGLGMWGYHAFEALPWMDAFLNAAMLLGGMGPVDPPHTQAGKLFAGLYALYSGLAFLILAGVIFTPVLHRVLHKFHWDAEN
jgi:hypothetical protein